MAEYTIELRDVVKNHNIFDFPYPFYDESKRPEFEEKFIRHFYFREIGCPTVDRFKIYLRDKMETVFPYYNELFKSAEIEYSILNNYNLTEEFTTTRESESKQHGYASAVGQLFGTQQTDSETNRENATTGKLDSTGKDTDTEKTVTTTEANGKTLTETTGKNTSTKTENVTTETDNSETANGSKSNVRKFIDTPQGLADLTDTKFMTDLTDTRETDSRTAKTDGKTTTDTSGNTVTDTTDNSESNTESTGTTTTQRDGEKNTTLAQSSTGSETGKDTTTATATDEQKTTSDSNTRTYADGKQTEKHTLTRIGNIGVDTDSDMIEKHNRLQKTLRQIEKLFFDECEDLFMLVY